MKLSITFAITLLANVVLCQTYYKHDLDWVSRHMATKTTYPTVSAVDSIVNDYKVLQLQLVKRHGTRYPSDGDTSDIVTILDILSQGTKQPKWLKNYKNEFLVRRSGALNLVGQLEEYTHGRRVARNFPNLINEVVDDDVLLHMTAFSSYSERTSQSSVAFQQGLFEGRGSVGSYHQFPMSALNYPENGDSIISIDSNCPTWENRDFDTSAESNAYSVLAGTPIANRLSKELGLNLTSEHVEMIYTGCTFDVAHHKRVDTFCSLLSKDDILVGEYVEDLDYFYEYGQGDALNSQVACALAQDIFTGIEAVVENKDGADYNRLALKFGHTQTVVLLETFLGLFAEDTYLRANSTQSTIENRIFRTSNIGNFASNVGFQVLQKKKSDGKFYIRVLVNEKPVVVPGCGVQVCPYETFKAVMAPRLTCNYNTICGVA